MHEYSKENSCFVQSSTGDLVQSEQFEGYF